MTNTRTGIVWQVIDEQTAGVASTLAAAHGEPEVGFRVVREHAALARLADTRLRDVVASARRNGASWAQIGQALGVTKQAAQQRYGD